MSAGAYHVTATSTSPVTASTRGNQGYTLAKVSGGIGDARPLATMTGPALQDGQRVGLHCTGSWIFGLVDGARSGALVVLGSLQPDFDRVHGVVSVFTKQLRQPR